MQQKTVFRFYAFVALGLVTGWLWVVLSHAVPQGSFSACFIKNIVGIPCPSCGATRSVHALLEGHWLAALQYNALGYLLAFLMVALPVALLYDGFTRTPHLYRFWLHGEHYFKTRPWQLALFLSPIFLNWFWKLYQ